MASRGSLVALGGAAVLAAVVLVRWDAPPSRATPAARSRSPATPAPGRSAGLPPAAATPPALAATATPRSGADPSATGYTMIDLRLALGDPGPDGTARLVDGLFSDDMVVVAEAADHLVARRATDAIPALAAIDLDARRDVTPAVTDGLGRLAGVAAAGSAARTAAVDRLLALLRAEKARDLPTSPATLLYLYEALGHTADPRAAVALTTELGDPRVGLAPKVVVVESLVRLGAAGSRDAMVALRARVLATPATDAFEAELERDLVTAIDRALPRLL